MNLPVKQVIDAFRDIGQFHITTYTCDDDFYMEGSNQQLCNHNIGPDWLLSQPTCRGNIFCILLDLFYIKTNISLCIRTDIITSTANITSCRMQLQ